MEKCTQTAQIGNISLCPLRCHSPGHSRALGQPRGDARGLFQAESISPHWESSSGTGQGPGRWERPPSPGLAGAVTVTVAVTAGGHRTDPSPRNWSRVLGIGASQTPPAHRTWPLLSLGNSQPIPAGIVQSGSPTWLRKAEKAKKSPKKHLAFFFLDAQSCP